jgi:hypothetical protein
MARADETTGGQIAAAIRSKYGLDQAPNDDAAHDGANRLPGEHRSPTGGASSAPARAAGGPKSPADWITGDEPMTDNQLFFLQRRLGDDVDTNMTKAEASILIEELLDDVD